MRWTPGGLSSDVEDRRGQSGGGFGGGGLGIVGFIILLVISLVTGRNYIGAYFSGGGVAHQQQTGPRTVSPQEDRSAQLASFVLGDAQDTWTQILAREGIRYPRAHLVLFRDYTQSGCGTAQSSTGPFYCPADQKVYLDLGFWDQLKQFGASGEFAQAYVIAHEIGHHVQNVLGIERKVRGMQQQNPQARNRLSVAMELQADCFAGVWAHSTGERQILEQGDVPAALQAAAAVGDDRMQKMARGYVTPDSFTHGSSQQRVSWFNRGFKTGQVSACNTFSAGR
ncbi:MAG TPA: neutral zinc metallopeptidase [Acidobacteriaceae bacterium]|nr:neutral zinc metallopeptidase [Acidobacteriaceae bacterium]